MLRDLVQTLVPQARVDSADTSVIRHLPPSHCVILSVGQMYESAESVVRELRARGNADDVLVVADDVALLPTTALQRLGARLAVATNEVATALPAVLMESLRDRALRQASDEAVQLQTALRQVQALIAAGQLAGRLQHRLNNPLAALLAEAQLLELEPLAPEVAASVRRIVELCRRVIDETRSIDGLANAGGGPA